MTPQSSLLSSYEQHRQGALQALDHLDTITQWLKIPQTVRECIAHEHWDDALALWDRCRHWQQQQPYHDGQPRHAALAKQIYAQVDGLVQAEMAQQLLVRLASDTALPELARLLGRLRRVWSVDRPQTRASIMPTSMPDQLAALLVKARLRWWQQQQQQQQQQVSALTVEQHLTQLSHTLDGIRTTLPEMHRQWQVLLLASHGIDDAKDAVTERGIMAAAAATMARHVVACIMQCLDHIDDLTHLAKLESMVVHGATSLGRYGSDPWPLVMPALHRACVRIVRQRITQVGDEHGREMERDTSWIASVAMDERAIDVLALPTTPISIDDDAEGMTSPSQLLLAVPIWARLYNALMMLWNDLRWYAPTSVHLPVAECMRHMLKQCAHTMAALLQRHDADDAGESVEDEQQHHARAKLVHYYVYVLAPILWHTLVRQLFGRSKAAGSTVAEDDGDKQAATSLDSIEQQSIQELHDILHEWMVSSSQST
ncbi:hypothetical protein SYNPS1DRAFT_28865 [Syncephalis pseudoplumigaleata]|uniref:Conserved oligomeric Golgi complex subunit 8 n=1 Tax=Syncephalis pseudoplumigaleata TaxID=1712513 RepID=A0A4P9Z0K5_9FUNG|nr:hypothetical protein SYNPS1DRAFT_28865 [Syncephalis pseudoplumigaleata]|eukprot:RKP25402.1 hypothetical protein SYNPS1DRAFT_28865 [Syncephalis pseudoplumigaleata]